MFRAGRGGRRARKWIYIEFRGKFRKFRRIGGIKITNSLLDLEFFTKKKNKIQSTIALRVSIKDDCFIYMFYTELRIAYDEWWMSVAICEQERLAYVSFSLHNEVRFFRIRYSLFHYQIDTFKYTTHTHTYPTRLYYDYILFRTYIELQFLYF